MDIDRIAECLVTYAVFLFFVFLFGLAGGIECGTIAL